MSKPIFDPMNTDEGDYWCVICRDSLPPHTHAEPPRVSIITYEKDGTAKVHTGKPAEPVKAS
jgi:hypothetical protein